MVSGIASSLAGACFAPVSQYLVDKLVRGIIHYLSKDKPSSSSSSSNHENNNQQELYVMVNELRDVSHKIKDAILEAEVLADDYEYLKNLDEQVKKMNEDYESTASTHQSRAKKPRVSPTKPLDLQDNIMIAKIREVVGKLNCINDDLSSVISMARISMELGMKDDKSPGVMLKHARQNTRVTTSSLNVSKIYGRDRELEMMENLIKEPSSNGDCNVNVIGMSGIGMRIHSMMKKLQMFG